MDHSRFDGLARLLGATTDRRGGARAALGAALGLALAGAPEDAPAARRPRREGPCASGKRKDNICSRNSDCCTGICNKAAGKKNRDGKGRCRCVGREGACTEDRNCCNGIPCNNGFCDRNPLRLPIPTGFPCVPGVDLCADMRAACTSYTEGAQTVGGLPSTGTYCLLPTNVQQCGPAGMPSIQCTGGYCAPGASPAEPTACGEIRIVDTCAGNAPYTNAGPIMYVLSTSDNIATMPVFCGMSEESSSNLVFTTSGAGTSCTADDECGLSTTPPNICVKNTSAASLLSSMGKPIGGVCLQGAIICSGSSILCPSFQPFTPTCDTFTLADQTVCLYAS